jgi:hypothetical protein
MNILKIGKLALVSAVGSLVWAGCASTANEPEAQQSGLETTVDPQYLGPQTQPQNTPQDMLFASPYQSSWTVESIE